MVEVWYQNRFMIHVFKLCCLWDVPQSQQMFEHELEESYELWWLEFHCLQWCSGIPSTVHKCCHCVLFEYANENVCLCDGFLAGSVGFRLTTGMWNATVLVFCPECGVLWCGWCVVQWFPCQPSRFPTTLMWSCSDKMNRRVAAFFSAVPVAVFVCSNSLLVIGRVWIRVQPWKT